MIWKLGKTGFLNPLVVDILNHSIKNMSDLYSRHEFCDTQNVLLLNRCKYERYLNILWKNHGRNFLMFQNLLKFIINFGFSPRQLVYVSFVKSLPTKLSDFNVGLLHHIYSNAQNNPTPIIPLKQSFFSFSSVTHRIPHGGAYVFVQTFEDFETQKWDLETMPCDPF